MSQPIASSATCSEIWLEGDHYKWRAMRANGVAERYCTGDAPPEEKFRAWARTVPNTLRNPLYHWTHLELKRYFGIDELLDESSAPRIWEQANAALARPRAFGAHGILGKFRVKAVCTTDDPTDDLSCHKAIAASGLPTRVFPTFRPDKALNVHLPDAVHALGGAAGSGQQYGASGRSQIFRRPPQAPRLLPPDGRPPVRSRPEPSLRRFRLRCTMPPPLSAAPAPGRAATPEEHSRFASYMMLVFGRLDAEKGWTKQMHLGARRNNNTRRFQEMGPDTGWDSIGDYPQGEALGGYLDRLDQENALPKIVIYNLNPADNYVIATMVGNFQDGITAGKIQFGSGWWFLDQKEAHAVADERAFQLRPDLPLPGHAHRFPLVHVVSRATSTSAACSATCSAGTSRTAKFRTTTILVAPLIRNICYGNARQFLGLGVE